MSLEEIQAELDLLQGTVQPETNTQSTDNVVQPDVQQTSTEGLTKKQIYEQTKPGEVIPGTWGLRKARPGVKGFVQDIGQGLWQNAAPIVGISDTIIDTLNLATPRGIPDIPKLPTYESNTVQALRNISGLVIPSLGIRSMAINAATKYHAAGSMATKAPWLYKLGNRKSFEAFAKGGIDIGTGGLVDYVAEQNQKDDNLFGVLKSYWPKTYQWIPNSIATTVDDTPGEKRHKNVTEGAIFSVLASVVEGVAALTGASKSVKRTQQFIPVDEKASKKALKTLTEDEFTNIKFSDKPVEDQVLRNYARKEKELNLLNEYYVNNDLPPIDFNKFTDGDTLVRTKDPDGILGAMADEAHIRNPEFESGWGRIGNIIHEATRKEGIQLENLSNRTLVSELTRQIKEGGAFSKRLKSNKLITAKMMDNAGKKLAATLLHPRVEPEEIIGLLGEFKAAVDESAVRIVGKKGITGAIRQLQAQMLDLDAHKARAYLATAEGGQISDFSEGARLMEDSTSILRTIEAMADRLEVLMVEKGLANFEANSMLSHMNAWKQAAETGDKEVINAAADTILANTNSRLTELIPEAKAWSSKIKSIAREYPEFLKPFLLANELTDGNVDTLAKLHKWGAANLGTFDKAFYDANPEMPSILVKGMWSNLFNSALSAPSTPIRAAVGNLTGLLGKGMATVTGSVLQGDLVRARKAMIAHFALDDTLQKAFDHMRLVFRKASTNPREVSYVMRGDIALQETKSVTALREWAAASAKNEEFGPQALLKIYDDLDAMASDPVLRFGGNSMTALDGFTRSVQMNTEAKYLAFNKIADSGEEFTEASFKKAYQEIYDKSFDANGMIKNDAVDAATSEIALNADSPIVEGFNYFLRRFPAARSFIWFPRTTANVIETFKSWSPAGVLSADYHRLWGPLGNKKIHQFSAQEIAEILTSKGKPVDDFAEETFEMIRAEVKGKAAIGSFFVTTAGMAAIGDRCTGTGHYDKARQRRRIRSGWKPKSCKMPGTNKVVSYEWMGPIGDWLALTIDIVDNADTLTSSVQEDLYNKAAFVLSSAFFNRAVLAQLEPMYDVLQGNGAAASRWASNFGNNFVFGGSLRNEIGKILYPQLRQLRTELNEQLRNRNAWLDTFDPERALPPMVNPIDGKPVGEEDNWFLRIWNRGPMKVHSRPSKEDQFLIDIEFNSSPVMNTSQEGAQLTNTEIAAINSVIGKQGYYKRDIQKIMRKAEKLTYTDSNGTIHKGFVNIIRAQRRGLVPSEILDTAKYENIYNDITHAYLRAKRLAEDSLPVSIRSEIRTREQANREKDFNQRTGRLDELYQDAGIKNLLSVGSNK